MIDLTKLSDTQQDGITDDLAGFLKKARDKLKGTTIDEPGPANELWKGMGANAGPYLDQIFDDERNPLQHFKRLRYYWLMEKDLEEGKGFNDSLFKEYIPGESGGWFGTADNIVRLSRIFNYAPDAEVTVCPEVIFYEGKARAWNQKFPTKAEWGSKNQQIGWLMAFRTSLEVFKTNSIIIQDGNEPWLFSMSDRSIWLGAFAEVFANHRFKLSTAALPIVGHSGWIADLEDFIPSDFRSYYTYISAHTYAIQNNQWVNDPQVVIDQIKVAQEFQAKHMPQAIIRIDEFGAPSSLPNRQKHLEAILEYCEGHREVDPSHIYQLWRPAEQDESIFNGCELMKPDKSYSALMNTIIQNNRE